MTVIAMLSVASMRHSWQQRRRNTSTDPRASLTAEWAAARLSLRHYWPRVQCADLSILYNLSHLNDMPVATEQTPSIDHSATITSVKKHTDLTAYFSSTSAQA